MEIRNGVPLFLKNELVVVRDISIDWWVIHSKTEVLDRPNEPVTTANFTHQVMDGRPREKI